MSFPSSPSSGQTAVINNITYSYSTSTQAWTRVAGQVTSTTYLNVVNNTPTNSTITGALQVVGGVGIGGGLFVGGAITATSFVGAFIGSGVISTATNLFGGTASQLVYQTGPGATGFVGPGTSGNVLVSNGTSAPTYNNTLTLTGTTAATSTVTGALQVVGGVGVGGDVWAGNIVTGPNQYIHFGGTTGTRIYRDGGSNGMSLQTNSLSRLFISDSGPVTVLSTASSTSTTTGALQVAGGVGIGGGLFVGGVVTATNFILNGYQVSTSTGGITSPYSGIFTITNTTSSISTNTGALQIRGGVGIGGGLFVGGTVTATNFVGSISGTASTASQINTIAQTANASYFPTFVDSNNASATGESVYTTSSFSINPSTRVLTAANIRTPASEIALGDSAGGASQGTQAIAIGFGAGINQGVTAVAIGSGAGNASQSGAAIAIGQNAGQTSQGVGAVAIGQNAGQTSQGNYSLALGFNAGFSSQVANSIILSAGSVAAAVTTATNAGLYISPIRSDVSTSATTYAVYYNPTTKEVTTSTAATGGSSTGTTSTFVISNTTSATSTASGALQVRGGAGVGGDIYAGGNAFFNINAADNVHVGIGTVTKPSGASAGSRFLTVAGSQGAYLELTRTSATTGGGVISGEGPGLRFYTHPNSVGSETYTERLRIRDTGAISFGTNGTSYGTSGQLLQSNGDAAPTWVNAPSSDSAQTLTDGATVTWNTSLGNIATLTLGGNRTIAAPSGLSAKSYILVLNQDATGSRTVTWNSVFKWPAGALPVLSTAANAKDVFSFFSDGTNLYGSYLRGVA